LEEKDSVSLLLPQGLLEFFKVTSAVLKDNAYHIYLEELNIHPEHLQGVELISKGSYEEVTVRDFPLRGKACFLNIKRRKWLNADDTGIRAFFKKERLDSSPVSCKSLAENFHVNGKVLEHQYVFHLSNFQTWQQKSHAKDWVLFPENLGTHLSIDETSLSQGELYTVLTNKAAKGKKGALVAMVKGTDSDRVIDVLRKLPEGKRKKVK
jgi:hypothetical protein